MVGLERPEPNACGHRVRHYITPRCKSAVVVEAGSSVIYYRVVHRSNLHHRIKNNELECILDIIESDDVFAYMRHEDYLKALYLVATVDYISRKNDIPLCDKYNSARHMRLKKPYYVGDSLLTGLNMRECIDEFLRFNIYEGDLYDAVESMKVFL